ncbi:hypothetical protein GF337_14705, partial [candidate division KSB1 bacterium]|nr:hypothetical protein [candidate division KSB1 bacterium]
MSEGGFKKVNDSDDALYGPRGLLVCGFPPADQEIFLEMLDETGLRALPVIFVVSDQFESKV